MQLTGERNQKWVKATPYSAQIKAGCISFWSNTGPRRILPFILNVGFIDEEHFSSREMMRTAVFNYIDCDYNCWRHHSVDNNLHRNNLTATSFRAVPIVDE